MDMARFAGSRGRLALGCLVLAGFPLAANIPAAGARLSPVGAYGCSPGSGEIAPTSAALKLRASGSYKFTRVNAVATSPSHGSWNRSGKKVHFKGGYLDGKTATWGSGTALGQPTVQLRFKRLFDGDQGPSTCNR